MTFQSLAQVVLTTRIAPAEVAAEALVWVNPHHFQPLMGWLKTANRGQRCGC